MKVVKRSKQDLNLRPQRDWFSRPAQYQTMPFDQERAIIEMITRKSQNILYFINESETGFEPVIQGLQPSALPLCYSDK